MKRLFILVAALIVTLALVGFAVLKTEIRDTAPIQFQGTVKYNSGASAPVNTVVKAYVGGALKGQVTLSQAGYYELTGDPVNFTTGTYTLEADDQIGMIGDEQRYKVQGTERTVCNITLNIAY